MKAAVVREFNSPVSIEDIEIDSPAAHEVLVRNVASGVCHSDWSAIDGTVRWFPLPLVLGHEAAGIVEAVGSEVTYVAPGDHVVTCVSGYCGTCEFCLRGRQWLCVGGTARDPSERSRVFTGSEALSQYANIGSFAEQVLVHEHAVAKIPKEMPLDKASLLGCGITTGLGAAINTAAVRPGDTVAVVGCGGVGLSVVQGARLCGAQRIVAVDMSAERRQMALQFGATKSVDASGGDAVDQVLAATGGGVDYAFEAVGSKATAEQAFGMLRPGGTAIMIGVLFGKTIEIPGEQLMTRAVMGSPGGSGIWRLDVPRYAELYLQGRLMLDELVTARISLDRLHEAFDAMHRGEGARTVIEFN